MNSCFPSFDSITDYPSSTNFINVLREVSNNATTAVDQKTMLETITELRRMRKYQRELFEKTFDNIISRFLYIYIKSQEENDINNIVLPAALSFLGEIFSDTPFEFDETWIERIYYTIEKYFFSSNETVRNISREVARQLAINMAFSITFELFFDSIMENNQEKKQFIFSLFQLAFDNVDQTTLIFKYEWNVILPGFNFTKESKGTMKFESVKKIMEMFRNKIGGRWNELVEWIPDDAKETLNLFFN